MPGFLEGKVVAITGAGRGIGRAVALECAKEGACVVVNDYGVSVSGEDPTSEVADAVVTEIVAAGGKAIAVADSVTTMEGGDRIVQAAVNTYGKIDGVVCVAGIIRERMLFNMTEQEWDPVIETHLKGTFTVFRAATAVMRKQEFGTLVGFTSGVGQLGSVAQANYAAAKAGIISLVRSTAVGMQRYGVTSNCVAPVANTRMSEGVPGGLAETGEPEDVARLVVFLLSDSAKEITGQTYTAVGGRIALWSQPREIRSMVKEGGWTVQEIADNLMTKIGLDEMPMFEIVREMTKARKKAEATAALAEAANTE